MEEEHTKPALATIQATGDDLRQIWSFPVKRSTLLALSKTAANLAGAFPEGEPLVFMYPPAAGLLSESAWLVLLDLFTACSLRLPEAVAFDSAAPQTALDRLMEEHLEVFDGADIPPLRVGIMQAFAFAEYADMPLFVYHLGNFLATRAVQDIDAWFAVKARRRVPPATTADAPCSACQAASATGLCATCASAEQYCSAACFAKGHAHGSASASAFGFSEADPADPAVTDDSSYFFASRADTFGFNNDEMGEMLRHYSPFAWVSVMVSRQGGVLGEVRRMNRYTHLQKALRPVVFDYIFPERFRSVEKQKKDDRLALVVATGANVHYLGGSMGDVDAGPVNNDLMATEDFLCWFVEYRNAKHPERCYYDERMAWLNAAAKITGRQHFAQCILRNLPADVASHSPFFVNIVYKSLKKHRAVLAENLHLMPGFGKAPLAKRILEKLLANTASLIDAEVLPLLTAPGFVQLKNGDPHKTRPLFQQLLTRIHRLRRLLAERAPSVLEEIDGTNEKTQ